MPLLDIRKQFIDISGRFDLVEDAVTYVNKGADFFINSGQDWLDRLGDIQKAESKSFQTAAIDSWYVLFPRSRSIQKVWASNNDGERWELEKLTVEDFRKKFPKDLATIDSGAPCFFTISPLRTIPEVAGEITIDMIGTTSHVDATQDHYNLTGVIFGPPTEEALTIEAHGLFYQPKLMDDTDMNFWSEQFPYVLVMSAMRSLEVAYRNTEGVRDWENAIRTELLGMEFDLADQQVSEFQQMEG